MSSAGDGIPVGEVHRSIGEVLALLRDEFPDVTISKIRFLESQGLVDPERTPSGYRRFYAKDTERLRWILRQQRENYLPLKVIKDRLEGADPGDDAADGGAHVDPSAARVEVVARAAAAEPAFESHVESTPRRVLPEPTIFAARSTTQRRVPPQPVSPAPLTTIPQATAVPAPSRTSDAVLSADDLASLGITAQELADSTGMRLADIAELERYGLLAHRSAGNLTLYDADALVVARLAAAFRAHGLEPRHLRMFKVAADREAALLEQVVLPMARQRTAEARRALHETVTDLSRLTDSLHSVLLRTALKSFD